MDAQLARGSRVVITARDLSETIRIAESGDAGGASKIGEMCVVAKLDLGSWAPGTDATAAELLQTEIPHRVAVEYYECGGGFNAIAKHFPAHIIERTPKLGETLAVWVDTEEPSVAWCLEGVDVVAVFKMPVWFGDIFDCPPSHAESVIHVTR